MNTLMKATPSPSLKKLFEDFGTYDSLFDGSFFNRGKQVPAVNIKENEKGFDIYVAVPGFEKEDFKLDIANNVLTISAERKDQKEEDKDNYTRKEFSYSSFSRSFGIPDNVKEDHIKAKYDKGILHLKLEKSDKALPKRKIIPVE
ncbi:MAG: Hsp20/alpha crystallin family protein [Arcticibacter sp.]